MKTLIIVIVVIAVLILILVNPTIYKMNEREKKIFREAMQKLKK